MSTKRLIINADDFNLTPGVSRGILKAHDEGIVTSTTVLINLPLSGNTIREAEKRKKLGLGLHLNVTLMRPLNRPSVIRSLVKSDGSFKRPSDYLQKSPSIKDLIKEYNSQIQLFQKSFEKKPDHLDTHHHLHDLPVFFQAVSYLAKKWKIPMRRSRIFQMDRFAYETKRLKTTDYLFGNLDARFYWQKEPFMGVLENLPEGTGEIGCHPAFLDSELRRISSLQDARAIELKLFSDKKLRKTASELGVELIRFSEI